MDIKNYELDEESKKDLWENGLFVFDTSPLLNMYKFSEKTIKEIEEKTFKKISKRIYLPFQVLFEFKKNVDKQIQDTVTEYNGIRKHIETIEQQLKQITNKIKKSDKHPVLKKGEIEKLSKELEKLKPSIINEIDMNIKSIENNSKDLVKELISNHFKLNKSLSYSEKITFIKEGEFRYKNKIPPGYMDGVKKTGFQIYGDLFVWKEIMKISKTKQKSIILVIDDLKEDWWVLDKKNRIIRERDELKEELYEFSGQRLVMYTLQNFLENSNRYLQSHIGVETINKAKLIEDSQNSEYVEVMASQSELEPHRIDRLNDVVKFYFNFISRRESRLVSLYDHKGELTATWIKEPTRIEREIIAKAWEYQAESRENIKHIIKDNPEYFR